MSDRPAIAIVGPGVVGTTLGIAASRAGYTIAGLAGRDESRARAAADRIGPGIPVGSAAEIAPLGQLVLLCVPDDAIAAVAGDLASGNAVGDGAGVAHCSGALGSDELRPLRDCGAAVGSIHPLQTFPDVDSAVDRIEGTYFFIEGDDGAADALTGFASAVGGRPVRIATDAKLLYHASAVLASNYMVALQDAALSSSEAAGIDRGTATEALRPLLEATLANVVRDGPAAALTGPISRGDARLVARQVAAIEDASPELAKLYRAMGEWTIGLALRKGSIDADAADALRGALKQD